MDLASYIVKQMEGVRGPLGGLVESMSDDEWTASPTPTENPLGFTTALQSEAFITIDFVNEPALNATLSSTLPIAVSP